MTRVLLVRHGNSTANTSGILAGWSPGVHLDARGKEQVQELAQRLREVPITHLVSSPLQRTLETARIIGDGRRLDLVKDKRVGELNYGYWTGEQLKKLAKQSLWAAVQTHPSSVTFPGGESMQAAANRAVTACRDWASAAEQDSGDQAVVLIVSHGDIIKAVLADALGMHLDMFQRIVIDPASLSVINYTALRPFVERVNDTGPGVAGLIPTPPNGRKSRRGSARFSESDAFLGGGSGPTAPRR